MSDGEEQVKEPHLQFALGFDISKVDSDTKADIEDRIREFGAKNDESLL